MYEYRDGNGELVTVRSLRTLERLLTDATIRGDTPFRTGGEASFVLASAHPVVGQLAAELALPFATDVAPPHPQADASSGFAKTATSDGALPEPLREPLPTPTVSEMRPRPLPPMPTLRPPSPWQPPPVVPPRERLVVPRKGASGASTIWLTLAWEGGAILGGFLAYGSVRSVSGSTIGVIGFIVVTAILARWGGVRLRRRDVASSAVPVWAASVILVCLLSLAGSAGLFMAIVAAIAFGAGWRSAAGARG